MRTIRNATTDIFIFTFDVKFTPFCPRRYDNRASAKTFTGIQGNLVGWLILALLIHLCRIFADGCHAYHFFDRDIISGDMFDKIGR